MKIILASYYGNICANPISKLIGESNESKMLDIFIDDGPETYFCSMFNFGEQSELTDELIDFIERQIKGDYDWSQNTADGVIVYTNELNEFHIKSNDVEYVFREVIIPDDITDMIFDCDIGADYEEWYLYYCRANEITRMRGYYRSRSR